MIDKLQPGDYKEDELKVVNILKGLGFECNYEYPGYVNFVDANAGQEYWTSGWLNNTWTIDVYNQTSDGICDVPVDGFDTHIPRGFKHTELIADMIILYWQIRRLIADDQLIPVTELPTT